jgi:uncharacterized protein (DUF2147 family)
LGIFVPKPGKSGHHWEEYMNKKSILSAVIVAGAVLSTPALADPSGTWLRSSGESRVRIAKCGDAYCGTIVWLKNPDGNAKVGQRVFYDMKGKHNKLSGKAFNPEDGKTYSGTISLNGRSMTTSGCVLGGIICRSVQWSKVN